MSCQCHSGKSVLFVGFRMVVGHHVALACITDLNPSPARRIYELAVGLPCDPLVLERRQNCRDSFPHVDSMELLVASSQEDSSSHRLPHVDSFQESFEPLPSDSGEVACDQGFDASLVRNSAVHFTPMPTVTSPSLKHVDSVELISSLLAARHDHRDAPGSPRPDFEKACSSVHFADDEEGNKEDDEEDEEDKEEKEVDENKEEEKLRSRCGGVLDAAFDVRPSMSPHCSIPHVDSREILSKMVESMHNRSRDEEQRMTPIRHWNLPYGTGQPGSPRPTKKLPFSPFSPHDHILKVVLRRQTGTPLMRMGHAQDDARG